MKWHAKDGWLYDDEGGKLIPSQLQPFEAEALAAAHNKDLSTPLRGPVDLGKVGEVRVEIPARSLK